MWELDHKKRLRAEKLMLLNCGAGEDFWESLGLQGDQTSQSQWKTTLNIHWTDWYWSWNSSTLATWYKELTHWQRPWCWERLRTKGKEGDRAWDDWMASLTQWAWVWVNSGSWWWIGRPFMLWFMESQSWTWLSDWTQLNWCWKDWRLEKKGTTEDEMVGWHHWLNGHEFE